MYLVPSYLPSWEFLHVASYISTGALLHIYMYIDLGLHTCMYA